MANFNSLLGVALLAATAFTVSCSGGDGDSSFFLNCSGITVLSPASNLEGTSGDGENPGSGISNPASPTENSGRLEFCTVADGTVTVTDNTTTLTNEGAFDLLNAKRGCALVTRFPDGSTIYPADVTECL